jgi:hypothetical protein
MRHVCCGISLACFYAPGHHWTFVTPVHYSRDHHLAAAHRYIIAKINGKHTLQEHLALFPPKTTHNATHNADREVCIRSQDIAP